MREKRTGHPASRRLSALALTLCLLLGIAPAVAATGDAAPGGALTLTQEAVDAVLGAGNATLSGSTITLNKDITVAATVTATGLSFTLDLNGHTLAGAAGADAVGDGDGAGGVAALKLINCAVTVDGTAGGVIAGGDGGDGGNSSQSYAGGGGDAVVGETDTNLDAGAVSNFTMSGGSLLGGKGGQKYSSRKGGSGGDALRGENVTLTSVTVQGGNGGAYDGNGGGAICMTGGVNQLLRVTAAGGLAHDDTAYGGSGLEFYFDVGEGDSLLIDGGNYTGRYGLQVWGSGGSGAVTIKSGTFLMVGNSRKEASIGVDSDDKVGDLIFDLSVPDGQDPKAVLLDGNKVEPSALTESSYRESIRIADKLAATVTLDGTETKYYSFAAAWAAAAGNETGNPATVKLLDDVTAENHFTGDANAPMVLEADVEVILDLNGKTMDRGLTKRPRDGGSVLQIDNGSLTLKDSVGVGRLTGGFAEFGGGVFVCGGAFTLESGTITGNTAGMGGGVAVNAGSATLKGGVVTGNVVDADISGLVAIGGGVYVSALGVSEGGELPVVKLSDGITVTGNTDTDGNASNAAVESLPAEMTGDGEVSSCLTVSGPLTGKIGVARLAYTPDDGAESGLAITPGFGVVAVADGGYTITPDDLSHFQSDASGLTAILNADGAVALVTPPKLALAAPEGIMASSAALSWSVTANGNTCTATLSYRAVGGSAWTTVKTYGSNVLTGTETLSNLAADTEYEVRLSVDYGGSPLTAVRRFRTQPAALPTGSISGSVTNNTGATCNITVTIEEGNTVRAAQTLASVSDNASGSFSFSNLPDGHYNVVADNGSYKVTQLITVENGTAVTGVSMTLGKTQSVVEIVTPDTPDAAVNGLPEQFTNQVSSEEQGYTAANAAVVTAGGTVELKLAVEKKAANTVSDDAGKITAAAPGKSIAVYLDLSVLKTVTPSGGEASETKLISLPKLLTVVLPLPADAKGRDGVAVYRVHNGTAAALPSTNPGGDGEWCEVSGTYITLHIKQFSTYAVGYTTPSNPGGSTGDGSSTTWKPEIVKPDHGTVTVSPESAKAGDNVTITAQPDAGYTVDTVTVKDADGKTVTVTAGKDGAYSFTQPSAKVTITVTFKAAEQKPAELPFTDVTTTDWFHDSVKYVYENGLMNGTGDTTFSPYLDTSRGMIVTILWRRSGSPVPAKAADFTDILPDQYYTEAVAWGAENGIITGYANGCYGPGDPITREQLAAILWRYARFKKYDVSIGESTNILSYLDYSQISEYAIPAIQWVVGEGIMSGKGGGILDPKGHATRAETAAMLERLFVQRPYHNSENEQK